MASNITSRPGLPFILRLIPYNPRENNDLCKLDTKTYHQQVSKEYIKNYLKDDLQSSSPSKPINTNSTIYTLDKWNLIIDEWLVFFCYQEKQYLLT